MNARVQSKLKAGLSFSRLIADLAPRIMTSCIRTTPEFIIIGAAKCGTSSLYQYLIQHPCIHAAYRKEVYFFDITFHRGIYWYKAFFPTILEKKYSERKHHGRFMTGEATPCYLFHPHAPKRISETIPDVKLIVLLRNPVDRAYSFYQMQSRRNIENLSFESALGMEQERLQGELDKMIDNERYFSFTRQRFSYLSRGIYIDQLTHWLKFFPREQLLVLISEDFYAAPSLHFIRVLSFLGLPLWEPTAYLKFNHVPYPEMNRTTRKRLVEYFAPYNQRLYDFLGVTLDWDR